MICDHRHRCRYTDGFYCEDCKTFFRKDSPTYRSDELLSDIEMTLGNITCDLMRDKMPPDLEIEQIRDKINSKRFHDDYEAIIADAEKIMSRYGKNANSCTIILR